MRDATRMLVSVSVAGPGKRVNASETSEMSKTAFFNISSRQALTAVWHAMYKNASQRAKKTSGVDNVSINDFYVDWQSNIAKLSKSLREGRFKFSPLRPHLIPKGGRKYRLIAVPTVADRIVQRSLLEFLDIRYGAKLANEISFGFVRNRGVKKAIDEACRLRTLSPWVFKTDITAFFDEIPRDRLSSAVTKLIRETSLHNLLIQAMSLEIDENVSSKDRERIRTVGIRTGRGVRQGMPLSPFFSNVILGNFDRAVVTRDFRAVRYADDLIFFANSDAECRAVFEFCQAELSRIGLRIPLLEEESKTKIYVPLETADFLGVSLELRQGKYRPVITQERSGKIRDEILALGSIPELLARRIKLPALGAAINHRRNGYLAAYEYCENVSDLEKNLDDLFQKVLAKIYRDGLNINLSQLSREARTFLGLS